MSPTKHLILHQFYLVVLRRIIMQLVAKAVHSTGPGKSWWLDSTSLLLPGSHTLMPVSVETHQTGNSMVETPPTKSPGRASSAFSLYGNQLSWLLTDGDSLH